MKTFAFETNAIAFNNNDRILPANITPEPFSRQVSLQGVRSSQTQISEYLQMISQYYDVFILAKM